MSLRDKPYLALYIQDFLTDEKLMECSASATGVYIRIMCIMHKSEHYGKILLKQKDKQTDKQILNFASKLAKHLPFDLVVIESGLTELIGEGCLHIEGDFLVQKRMVSDEELSVKRSESGSKGGRVTQDNIQNFAKAKPQANTDIDNEYIGDNKEGAGEKEGDSPPEIDYSSLTGKMINVFKIFFPKYPIKKNEDSAACLQIAYGIALHNCWETQSVYNGKMEDTLRFWERIVAFGQTDNWFSTRSISDYNKEWQRLIQKFENGNKSHSTSSTAHKSSRDRKSAANEAALREAESAFNSLQTGTGNNST